jgi:hypothetical protein
MPNNLAQQKVKPAIESYTSTQEFHAQNHLFFIKPISEQWAPIPGIMAQFFLHKKMPKQGKS